MIDLNGASLTKMENDCSNNLASVRVQLYAYLVNYFMEPSD